MKWLAVILLILVVGCGDGPRVDPGLQFLVEEWNSMAAFPVDVDVVADDSILVLGQCQKKFGTNIVKINPGYDTDNMRTTFWHELGHCSYGREHGDTVHGATESAVTVNGIITDIPMSVMPDDLASAAAAGSLWLVPGAAAYYICEIESRVIGDTNCARYIH